MSVWHMQPDLAASRRQHKQLYQVRGRYLRYVGLVALACLLYYVWFFSAVRRQRRAADHRPAADWPLPGADVRLARLLELAVRLLLYANRRHPRPSSSPGR